MTIKIVVFLTSSTIVLGSFWYISSAQKPRRQRSAPIVQNTITPLSPTPVTTISIASTTPAELRKGTTKAPIPQPATPVVIARNLDTPWAIAFLPDNMLLVTERPGRVRLVDPTQPNKEPLVVTTINKAREISEGGLLGIALHPNFAANNYVYLYYTYTGDENQTHNRVVRMTYHNKALTNETIIIDNIPGAPNHNGGRIRFGPDELLYITTGDAQNPSQAQDKSSLAGKILRVTDTGAAAPENPFGTRIFSYGHRNPQGIAWSDIGELWATEHGRSGILSGLDELNLIKNGNNYGWPTIQGNEARSDMQTPRLNSGSETWAPAGAAFVGNSLFFGGLRGQTLYEAVIGKNTITLKKHFTGEFGRIREVIKGPDGLLYITTSNHDGRGNPDANDDKIIVINPVAL